MWRQCLQQLQAGQVSQNENDGWCLDLAELCTSGFKWFRGFLYSF